MKKIFAICLALLTLVSCSDEKNNLTTLPKDSVIVSIPDIGSKSLSDVEKVIGKSQKCEKSKYGQHCVFANGDIEITFINEKADWITVNSVKGKKFDDSSLGLLGLPKTKVNFKNEHVARWGNIQNYLDVEFALDGQDKIFFGYIKVNTK